MRRIAVSAGRPGRGWLLFVTGLLLLWSCSDILNDPAPRGDLRPLSLRLDRAPAPGGPNPSIAEALERADAARVRVQRGQASEGETVLVLDTVVAFARGENEARLRVSLDATVAGEPLLVRVQILGGEAILFEGSTTVTLEGSGTTSAEVTIEPVVATVDAGDDPPPLTAIGATLQLAGEARFATGEVIDGVALTWRALDAEVVEVSADGGVVAVANGEARVEGSHAGLTDTVVVRVAQAVASIVVTPASVGLEPGEGQQFTASAEDANGNPIADPPIVWSSSDAEVVSIDAQSGLARAVAVGDATISATFGEVSGSAEVAVSNPGPVVDALNPERVVAGGFDLTLVLSGRNFVPTSVVRWNGSPRETEFVSASELRATIPASDLDTEGSAAVTVVNPPPGGGESTARTFTIEAAPVLVLDPVSIDFVTTRGGGDPAQQTVNVSNGGSGSLGTVSYEIVYLSGRAWLQVTPETVTAPAALTLTATVGQLAPGSYEAEVRFAATGASGGPRVLTVTLTIEETVPAPPSQLAIARTGLDVDLRWLDNSDNEAGFAIERAEGEGAFAQTTTVTADETTFSDPGLEWGPTYRYRVRAFNSAGASAPSNEVRVVVQDPPSADTQDPQDVTYGSATLRGVVSGNGLGFNYRFGWQSDNLEYSDSTAWTGSAACDPAVECVVEAPLGTLYGAREYYYWIEVENALGAVVGDTVYFRTLPAVPPTVQSDSVDVDIPNSARMYFTVSPNGDDFYSWVELSYSEEFGEPVRFSGDSLHVLRGRLGSTDSWEIFTDIVDLRPGTTYYWRPMLRMFDQRIIEGAVGSFTTSGTPPVANRMPSDGGASLYGDGRLAALQMEDRSSGVAATRYRRTDRGEARGAR